MLTAQMLRPPPALREAHVWCIFPEEVDSVLLKRYRKFLCPEEQEDLTTARTSEIRTARLLARTLVRTTLARWFSLKCFAKHLVPGRLSSEKLRTTLSRRWFVSRQENLFLPECNLSDACGHVDPSSLRFKKNAFGKPQVIWPTLNTKGASWRPPNLCFNLSHTESLIACAVTLESPIGIDVEETDRKLTSNLIKFARRRFSSKEADWLQSLTESEEQHQQFMRLWTLKEAYVKAVGKGIGALPFKDFTFHFKVSADAHDLLRKVMQLPTDPQAKAITLELAGVAGERERPSTSWKFVLFQPGPAHVASICVEDHNHDGEKGETGYKVQTWKTVPLVLDQPLSDGAMGLGVSNDYKLPR